MRGNTTTPPPTKVATSRFYDRVEDIPPDHTGPFTVGHVRDRADMSLRELAEMHEQDAAEWAIDNDQPREDDDFVWGQGEQL